MTHIVIGAATIGFCFGWWTADEARRIARRRRRRGQLDFSSPKKAVRGDDSPRPRTAAPQGRKPW